MPLLLEIDNKDDGFERRTLDEQRKLGRRFRLAIVVNKRNFAALGLGFLEKVDLKICS